MYTPEDIVVVIPSYNTADHLENTYKSVRKYYPNIFLLIISDGSTDGTQYKAVKWSEEDSNIFVYHKMERKGHTYWYDAGIGVSGIPGRIKDKPVVSILHSDMIVGPGYFENMLKHLKPGKVVCATRVEPPIHPSGKEKITRNFGMEADDFQWDAFEKFCLEEQEVSKDETTRGIFAPWTMLRDDFISIGGHDQRFAPYGYEDSDIFNRWILKGYEMIQSRDSLCYHMTCRGHRWNKGVGIDNPDYRETMEKNGREFIRKWGDWIQNDAYQYPIIYPKYDRGIILYNGTPELLKMLEPWGDGIYTDIPFEDYIKEEQPKTVIDLTEKIKDLHAERNHDIFIEVDGSRFDQRDFEVIQHLAAIAKQAGRFQIGNLRIVIDKLEDNSQTLIDNEEGISRKILQAGQNILHL